MNIWIRPSMQVRVIGAIKCQRVALADCLQILYFRTMAVFFIHDTFEKSSKFVSRLLMNEKKILLYLISKKIGWTIGHKVSSGS